MSNGEAVNTFSEKPMAVENEPFIPVQVKYVEAHTATVKRKRRNPDAPKIQLIEPEEAEIVKRNHDVAVTPTVESPLQEQPQSPDMSPTRETPNNSMTPNKFQYDPNLSYAEKVAHEMIMTERIYLENLKQIIDGFLGPATNNPYLGVAQENVDDLFINVEEIYNFNWVLLQDMEVCDYNPVKLAECFVFKQIGFGVYTKYCTHYPRSMEVLLEWTQREDTANFIKNQQVALGHTLPLCSFLLKPVQRILKYHLLLGNIAKHYKQSEDEEGYETIQKALSAMTNVAKHINDMKRKHEDALHSQEIQSVLLEYEGPNLTSYGSLVLEDTFRLHGTRTGRYLLLFEKALLITKRRSDGTFTWKATIEFSNMMLADSVFREPLTYQVIPFDDRKMCYTFVSRDMDTKNIWLFELKQRLLDSYAAKVPMKAKQIILGRSRDCEKENAEPDSEAKPAVASGTRRGANLQRTPTPKDNTSQPTKLHKFSQSENRKSKDSEDLLEDKTSALIDSIKSPLRRKLRVFKKRKFSKEKKRVSWSSDDYEQVGDNELLSPCEDNEDEDLITENDEADDSSAEKPDVQRMEANSEVQENNETASVESPVMDDASTISNPEEDSPISEPSTTPPHTTKPDTVPMKKRRLTKEDRERSTSMPAEELLSRASNALKEQRSHSLNGLDESGSIKDRHHGAVQLRENAAVIRTRRLGSNEDSKASLDSTLRRNPGVDNLTDDICISTIEDDSSVSHTMRCVSAAFSDISTSFSRDDTPVSSTEDISQTLDEESDDMGTAFLEEGASSEEDKVSCRENGTHFDDNNNDDETHIEKARHQSTIWDRIEIPDGDNDASLCDQDQDETSSVNLSQSGNDEATPLASEISSYTETLSDSSDEQEDESTSIHYDSPSNTTDNMFDTPPNVPLDSSHHFDGTYQKVFALKRSYSEENLISKSPVPDTCTYAEDDASCGRTKPHSVVTRSHSVGGTPGQRWSDANPFAFAVTPKKKIVIKDSLWETIKEDADVSQIAVATLANDEVSVRRRKKRKGRRKRASSETRDERSEKKHSRPVLRSCASLEIADYRCADKDDLEISEENDDVEHETEPHQDDDDDTDITSASSQSLSSTSTPSENAPSEVSDVQPVTKVAVALKTPGSTQRDRTMRRVDDNVSEVPTTINYLCIEQLPMDELSNEEPDVLAKHEKDSLQTESTTGEAVSDDASPSVEPTSQEPAETTMEPTLDNPPTIELPPLSEVPTVELPPSNSIPTFELSPPDEVEVRAISDEPEVVGMLTGGESRSGVREGAVKGPDSSKVGQLSKYFVDVTAEEDLKVKGSTTDTAQNSTNIKERAEALRRRKRSLDEKYGATGNIIGNLLNIKDRIDVLKRSSWQETRASKSRVGTDLTLYRAAANVKNITTRLEQFASSDLEIHSQVNEGLRNQLQTSLSIRDRVSILEIDGQEETHEPAGRSKSMDECMPTWQRVKDRIETLRSDKHPRELDSERDITISDGSSEGLTSPRQNEELRTVVIKRGWVQQFVQKIETGT